MQITRRGAKPVPGQPQIDITRLDLADLSQLASQPVRLDSAYNERFSLDRLRLLVLNSFQIPLAQFCQRELPLGAVNLGFVIFLLSEIALSQFPICRFQTAPNLFAARFEACIISAVPVAIQTWSNFPKCTGFLL